MCGTPCRACPGIIDDEGRAGERGGAETSGKGKEVPAVLSGSGSGIPHGRWWRREKQVPLFQHRPQRKKRNYSTIGPFATRSIFYAARRSDRSANATVGLITPVSVWTGMALGREAAAGFFTSSSLVQLSSNLQLERRDDTNYVGTATQTLFRLVTLRHVTVARKSESLFMHTEPPMPHHLQDEQ